MIDIKKIEKIIDLYRTGGMIIVVDDKDRENEGDLIISAEKIKPEDINFMIKEGRGLVCVTIDSNKARQLNLTSMSANNTSLHETNFTVSVDATKGTTTGISAKDRWQTIQVVLGDDSKPSDLAQPGHMFPIIAKDGGVLQRAGHTEASVDLAKLAKLKPVSVIVEIIDDNGEMARMKSLTKISKKFNLPILSIAELIEYRRIKEKLVIELTNVALPNKFGNFKLKLFEDKIHRDHHIALVKGDIKSTDNVLVRVHSQCLTGDIFGSFRCDCGEQLDAALSKIEKSGKGILVYLRQEGRGIGLKNKILSYKLQEEGLDTVEANHKLGFKADLREYGIGAQILIECGVKNITLLTNNPRKVVGIEGYGISIQGIKSLSIKPNKNNKKYLSTKRDKLGHFINVERKND